MPTATPFNNLITFSRGSNATVTGSNGLIQYAPNNLLTFSEQFDNAAWQKFGGGVATAPAVTANAGVAPDGTTTADRVQFTLNGGTTSTDRSLLSQSATLATSFPYTYSIWVRSLTGTLSMGIGCDNLVGNTPITVTTEWQRFTVSGTATGTAGVALLQLRGGQTPVQSNAADVLVWGAQLELGSTATTYNPTTVKNLLGFSEAFDNAAWTKTDVSIVTGAQANPVNGLFNAQKLMENTANNLHRVFLGASVSSGVPYVYSTYAKGAERSRIQLTSSAGVSLDAIFDLSNGTVVTAASGTASIVSVGSGWYRCSVLNTAASSTSTNLQIRLIQSGTVNTYTGDGNSGVYIYGAQLSDSASLDPYVPTPGAAPSSTAFYGPRFDFDPVTRAPRGLLVEEQRTNLATYSDQFNNAAWVPTGATVSANVTASPDGTTNADKLVETAVTSDHHIDQSVSFTTGTTYTFSFYAKAGERSVVAVRSASAWAADPRIRFTLIGSGTVTVDNGTPTGTITAVGNGWYRCTMTATTNATVSGVFRLSLYNGAYSYAGDGTSGLFIYGAQLEAGAFATSYIPTVASTVTRSADVATITGQNFGQWYRQDEGSFVFEGSSFGIGSNLPTFLNASDGTTNNYLRMNGASGYTGRSFVQSGGATSANITVGAGLASGVNTKTAAVYAANSFQLSVNATLGTEDTSGAVPVTPNQIAFGNWFGSAGTILNGHIRNIRFIPARAADFQLQALST